MIREGNLFSQLQHLSFDYSRVIRIQWKAFPSSWQGYRELAMRRKEYRRLANWITWVIFSALITSLIALASDASLSLANVEISLKHLVIPLLLLSYVLLLRKSQLYIMQLDDHQIADASSFWVVHIQLFLCNLIWSVLVLYLALQIDSVSVVVSILGAISTLVAILFMVIVTSYYGIIWPLKKWIGFRISLGKAQIEITCAQVDKLMHLLLLEHRKKDTRAFLLEVFQRLGLEKERVSSVIDEVLKEQPPQRVTRVFQYFSQFISAVIAVGSALEVLKRSGLF